VKIGLPAPFSGDVDAEPIVELISDAEIEGGRAVEAEAVILQ